MMRIRLDLGKTPFFVFMRGTDFMGPKSPLGSGTNQISKKAQNYSHVLGTDMMSGHSLSVHCPHGNVWQATGELVQPMDGRYW